MPINLPEDNIPELAQTLTDLVSSQTMLDALAEKESTKEGIAFQFNLYSDNNDESDDEDSEYGDMEEPSDTSDIIILDNEEKKQTLEFFRQLYKRRIAKAKIALTKAGITIT